MTNEEAITILEDMQAKFNEEYIDYGGVNEAYKMAIKALEQQPCEDAVSRDMALKESYRVNIDGDLFDVVQVETLIGLPSVTLKAEPCEDAVSRDMVINKIEEWADGFEGWQYFSGKLVADAIRACEGIITELPSVIPKAKIGHWIDDGVYAEGHNEHAYRCSECDENYIGYVGEFKYCPNCGADMRGDEG